MKLIFITREGLKNPGARIRCYGFSKKLQEKGINTQVFSFADRLGAKSGKDDADFKFREKLKLIYQSFKLFYKESSDSIFVINRFNYHALSPWLVSLLKGIPLIFDMDDWEARENKGSKAEYLTRILAKRSIFCVAASSYLKDYLSQFNQNVYFVPTGVDATEFKASGPRKSKDFIFSWHGSINRPEIVRYIRFIIDCFLVTVEKYPFIKLFIAGDGIYKRDLLKLLDERSHNNIVYKGYVKHDRINGYLDNVDAGLVPLLDETRFNLSKSPVKLFEYMAKSKPVIASAVGEATSVIKDNYNGLLASSTGEFVSCMEQLIKNPDAACNMGANAHRTINENYSMDVLSRRLHDATRDNLKVCVSRKQMAEREACLCVKN
ncbi:glycosyltransferase [Candidatus Omnitrophota bacterium]